MKSKFLLFAFFLSFSFAAEAQQVVQEQRSMVTKVTATWCSRCGSWGWDLFDNLVEDNNEKALVIANHYSGDLTNQTTEDIADNYGVQGQPTFLLDGVDQNASPTNLAAKRMEIQNAVNNAFNTTPIANAGVTGNLNGTTLTVDAKAKFFQAASGEYYLGVYIIEDGVINRQSARGNDAVHKNVLRGNMSQGSFGVEIANGMISADSEFTQQFSVDLDPTWNTDNISLATIIWKKEGDDYSFVNTYVEDEWQATTTSNNNELAKQTLVKLQPSIAVQTTQLSITLEQSEADLQIDLVNALGQTVRAIHNGDLAAGLHTFTVSLSDLTAGVYFARLQSENGIVTKRLVKQ